MKNLFIVSLVGLVSVMSCTQDGSAPNPVVIPTPVPAPNEDLSVLQRQFHGKYKVLSSTSSEPVDVNLDGVVSENMIRELTELGALGGTQYNVEILIYGPSQNNPKSSYSFMQWWPEQFIRIGPGKVWDGGEALDYNPNLVVKYDFQGAARQVSFSPDLKQLTVKPAEKENPFRWVKPESVTVEDSSRLRVVNKRRLYTRAGVREVTITTVYERFTTNT